MCQGRKPGDGDRGAYVDLKPGGPYNRYKTAPVGATRLPRREVSMDYKVISTDDHLQEAPPHLDGAHVQGEMG